MKNIFNKVKTYFYNLFNRTPKPIFTGGETVLERYGDHKVIGSWGTCDPNGNVISIGGDIFSETVKFKSSDGIHLGNDWVIKNENGEDWKNI